jgi:hypothetical protein
MGETGRERNPVFRDEMIPGRSKKSLNASLPALAWRRIRNMKLRWKITIGVAVGVVVVGGLLSRPNRSEQIALEETRRVVRQQGFKTDLAEFNFATSAESRARETALTNAGAPHSTPRDMATGRQNLIFEDSPNLMTATGSKTALVVWKQELLPGSSGADLWPILREILNERRAELDGACEAALAGPIRFDLDASRGFGMLLRHCAALKGLAQMLGKRVVFELHEHHNEVAWTNLLALTRLVTAWAPEPTEVSHLVRCGCVTVAFNAMWQALQAEGWREAQLVQLQREWEAVDFFRELPETAAFARASTVALCQFDRQQPASFGMTLEDMVHAPSYVGQGLVYGLGRIRYRNHGSYDDERRLLLYYRDRELQLKRAAQAPTWLEMRQLPGVTNLPPFQAARYSPMQSLVNMRQNALNLYGRGQGAPGRAAEAEARRRIVVTAIVLERYRNRKGSYPKTLQELVPDWIESSPVDFMDGQPLRYHPTEDGRFALYSIGLDCTDNGGEMKGLPPMSAYEESSGFGLGPGTDLLWHQPASRAEVVSFRLSP